MANAEQVLTAAARVAFVAGEHGNFRGFDALRSNLDQLEGPQSEACRLALRAIRWSFDPSTGKTPKLEEARALVDQSDAARELAGRACSVMERVCIRTFDGPRLAAWVDVHAALVGDAAGQGRPADDAGRRDVGLWSASLWQRLLAGDTAGQETAAKLLFDEASRQRAAPQVIESTVLRALLALSAGSTDDAVELARRASRMAQSEALPQLEYLANITLARVRRYSGRPHLALHILAALSRVAPPAWHGWIGWETLLGGGDPGSREGPAPDLRDAPAMIAERDLAALIAATRGGNRAVFVAAAAALENSSSAWADLGREVQALLAALDPMRGTIPDFAIPWSRGETASIPCGLHGVGIPPGSAPEAEGATAFVVAEPGSPGRRFLSPGLVFAPSARLLARDSTKTAAGGVRTETGIAALALVGDVGTTREVFFRSVYGFPFVAHRHQAVLDVLCHRMRNLLGDAGEVRRDSGDNTSDPSISPGPSGPSLALVLKVPIVVPDMRCALPTADRVLRALATLGTTSASTAADSLRMPLRTVQAVLQQLVAEGACSIERDGRRVAYKIEDTTFTEVTSG
jgi:hypothetical protein